MITPYRLYKKFEKILGGSDLINYDVGGIEELDKKDKGLLERASSFITKWLPNIIGLFIVI